MKLRFALVAATALTATTPAFAKGPSLQAEVALLKAQVAAQQQQIAAQNAQLAAQAKRIQEIDARLQVAVATPTAPAAANAAIGSAPSAVPAAPALADNSGTREPAGSDTTIGGYGEISYNGYVHDASRNQADLKRFVLFFGHRFNDRISFNSEVEVEHAVASSGDQGEVEIEQAYLNYAFNPELNVKAGLFLMPFGFINRNHEPPVFYGVERNEVERRIIPSTWREGGVSVWGSTPFGISYDVGVTTGFDFAKLDDAGAPLLGTHQELQLAHAASLSVYGSLEYTPTPGVLIGGAVFTGKTGHANADFKSDPTAPDFAGVGGRVTLWDVHARVQHSGFDIEALYSRGTFANSAAIDQIILDYNSANGAERAILPSAFYGWLIQGAYSFSLGGDVTLDPFVRYEKYDTQAKLPLGLTADPANRDRVLTTGVSFHPLHEVVVKLDYQKFFENRDNDRINLGLGYMF
ncbi:porin [Sphingobium mellinum]|uniref:porin n=1 Tax=Sphingobium mellinum TaxID=1387166 RepID=UPI0030EB8C56